ncbi:MAG: hypothetical protein MUF71_04795 [Candidatus Kapabacteria bacterium]|nr:hypothetical protein [Candidatus Kapabacteria bacterium]
MTTRIFTSMISAVMLIVLMSANTAIAQVQPTQQQKAPPKTAGEIQSPFDKDGKLWIITEEMERQYGFFPQYRNVIDARLFQLPDSTFVLELLQMIGSASENTRIRLSLADLIDLRNRVSDALQRGQLSSGGGGLFGANFARPLDERILNDVEKLSLVLSATALGLSYGFLSDAFLFNSGVSNPLFTPAFGTMTIAAPIAFGAGALWAVNQPWFTRSSSLMMFNGLTSGFLHGAAGYLLFADQNRLEGRTIGVSGLLGSVIEAGATLRLPEALNLSYGQTSMMVNMGGSTFLTGAMASIALGAFSIDSRGNLSPDALRWTALSSLATSAGGYFLGYHLGQTQHIAPGDDIVFENPAGFLSLIPVSLAFPSFLNQTAPPDFRLLAGATIGAQALGYLLGHALIQNKDFSFDQGRQINQFASLGATLGLIPLYAGFRSDIFAYAPLLSAAGGAVGFAIGYFGTAKQAEANDKIRRASTSPSTSLEMQTEERENTWFDRLAQHTDMKVSPLGLLGIVNPTLGLFGVASPIVSIQTNLGAVEREETERQYRAIQRDTASQRDMMIQRDLERQSKD